MDRILISCYFHFYKFYNKKIMKFDGVEPKGEAVFAIAASLSFIWHNTLALILILQCITLSRWVSIAFFIIIYYFINKYFNQKIGKRLNIDRLDFKIIKGKYIVLFFVLMIIYNIITPIIWAEIHDICIF